MKQEYKEYSYLKGIIKNIPESYEIIKKFILDLANDFLKLKSEVNYDFADRGLSIFLNSLLVIELKSAGWRRKHIYLLLCDILDHINPDINQAFLDIESGLVGDCGVGSIDHFPDEPENREDLSIYVRGYYWLKEDEVG